MIPVIGRSFREVGVSLLIAGLGRAPCHSQSKPCKSLEGVRHRTRSRKVEVALLGDVKTCRLDEVVNFAIEVTSACNTLPDRGNAIVPFDDTRLGRASVLNEEHLPV